MNDEQAILLSRNTYNEIGQLVNKSLHRGETTTVTSDPQVGQAGALYGSSLTLDAYHGETAAIANRRVTLMPGFRVPAGSTFSARIGFSEEDAAAHNEATRFAQSIDYRYNIRGWLTRINESDLKADRLEDKPDLFGMNLDYDNNPGSLATAPSSLVSWYKLDGNANDAGPLGLNGSYPRSAPTPTTDAQGNSGKAMAFNGPAQAIKLNNTEDQHAFIQNTGRFTIAAFIKLNDVNTRSEILSNGGSSGLKGFRFLYETTGGSAGTQ